MCSQQTWSANSKHKFARERQCEQGILGLVDAAAWRQGATLTTQWGDNKDELYAAQWHSLSCVSGSIPWRADVTHTVAMSSGLP